MTAVLAAVSTAVLGVTLVRAVAGSPPLLHRRLAPYVASARSRLGLPPVRNPSMRRPVGWMSGLRSASELGDRLRQAGLASEDVGAEVLRFRVRWAVVGALGATAGVVLSTVLALDPGPRIGLVVAATAAACSRPPASLTKRVEDRAEQMRSEVYTVDQVLAVWIRSGASVAGALERVVRRGRGPVIDELERALRLHRGGLPLADALRRVAERTPEPACARTYRTLAAGTERGTDLGGTLLALAEDVRDARREAVRRRAVRRRAAMLVPIVAVLAPVLLLFVAAPLPSIVFGTP